MQGRETTSLRVATHRSIAISSVQICCVLRQAAHDDTMTTCTPRRAIRARDRLVVLQQWKCVVSAPSPAMVDAYAEPRGTARARPPRPRCRIIHGSAPRPGNLCVSATCTISAVFETRAGSVVGYTASPQATALATWSWRASCRGQSSTQRGERVYPLTCAVRRRAQQMPSRASCLPHRSTTALSATASLQHRRPTRVCAAWGGATESDGVVDARPLKGFILPEERHIRLSHRRARCSAGIALAQGIPLTRSYREAGVGFEVVNNLRTCSHRWRCRSTRWVALGQCRRRARWPERRKGRRCEHAVSCPFCAAEGPAWRKASTAMGCP
jgi:hypothetical protein